MVDGSRVGDLFHIINGVLHEIWVTLPGSKLQFLRYGYLTCLYAVYCYQTTVKRSSEAPCVARVLKISDNNLV